MPVKPKHRPKKQHDVRGASLARIAKGIRAAIKRTPSFYTDAEYAMTQIANVIETEARRVSKLR